VVDSNGRLNPLFAEAYSTNRQALPEAYLPNGAIYAFKLSEFKKENKFPFVGSLPYFMSEDDSVDIDTQADFDRAKALLER
jgi:CMP-N-acetylneuraminic acid synthetase